MLQTASCRGFTLIELMIVVAVMGILASAAMPLGEMVVKREKERELRIALRQIRTAIDAYKQAADEGLVEKKADETGYPHRLEDLDTGMDDVKDPDSKKIFSCAVCRAIRCFRILRYLLPKPGENAVMPARPTVRRREMTFTMFIPFPKKRG